MLIFEAHYEDMTMGSDSSTIKTLEVPDYGMSRREVYLYAMNMALNLEASDECLVMLEFIGS